MALACSESVPALEARLVFALRANPFCHRVGAILVIAPGMANTIHGAEYKIRSYAPKWIRSQGEHEARLKGGD